MTQIKKLEEGAGTDLCYPLNLFFSRILFTTLFMWSQPTLRFTRFLECMKFRLAVTFHNHTSMGSGGVGSVHFNFPRMTFRLERCSHSGANVIMKENRVLYSH